MLPTPSRAPVSRGHGLALGIALFAHGCLVQPGDELARASHRLEVGQWRLALETYDGLLARPKLGEVDRVRALTGAALASDKLGDPDGAERRLERAISPEIAGVSEPALYYLAEHIRARDRARALNLYYRAASGAEKTRAGGFPYRAAMARIVELTNPMP